MGYDRDADRANARLTEPARDWTRADDRRIIVVGARGWVGRTVLTLLREALGSEALKARVACFGSAAGKIVLDDSTELTQRPAAELAALPRTPSLLLHLAFLTKDKVAGMDADAYVAANRALSRIVFEALEPIGVDRLFVASSGAADKADDPKAAHDLRLYGRLKCEDELRFAGWAQEQPAGRRTAIGRIYSVSGPHINKHETYALASFINDALAGRPIEVRAPMRVLRSYAAVREVVSFVFAHLLARDGPVTLRFDTGGDPLELEVVAQGVAALTGAAVIRRPVTSPAENRYVGDDAEWRRQLARFGMAPVTLHQQLAETLAYLARTDQRAARDKAG